MSIDLSKLTPPPWSSVAQFDFGHVGPGKRSAKFVLARGMEAIAIFDKEEDCDAVATMRNALDVQVRRGWWSEPVGKKWRLSKYFRYLVEDDGEWWSVAGAEHDDPLTPLVTSDQWMKAKEAVL